MYALTIFTPTYNRAHTLERTYRSLCAQTAHDFEWLVVDDGSTDGTRRLVEGF
ncbi:MAG: glycosyltransferase family 2 protein, partial [Muribaculaceae bacterium]|nr:glycosyltransferase family 2 protein [Muribaculaceae bacterium]